MTGLMQSLFCWLDWSQPQRVETMNFKLGRAFYLYLIAFAVAGVTPFLLLPILTKHLSPNDFGQVASFVIWATLLASVAGLSSHGFVSVRFFKVEVEKFRALISSSIVAVALAHLLAAILMVALFKILDKVLNLPLIYTALGVIASFLLSVNLLLLTVFQVTSNPLLYFRIRVLQASIELVLCVALIYFIAADSGSRIYSYTLALMASVILGLIYIRRLGLFGTQFSLADIKELLKFSGPLIPHIVAGTLISTVDRLVVSAKLGAENLGIYMVSVQIGMAMIILIDPLNKALMPWLYEQLKKDCEATRRMIVIRTYQLLIALVVVGCLLSVAADYFFDMVIDEQYAAARGLIPWFVAGFVMQGMYYTQVNYLFYAEQTGKLSLVTVSVTIVGTFVSWQITSIYSLEGAAASFFINSLLLFLFVWVASSRVVSMPWGLRK